MQVSVRDLKNHLSKYLHLVREGKKVTVTSHNKPLAEIRALPQKMVESELQQIFSLAGIRWNGKKPTGSESRPKIIGKTAAEMILEDRR